MSLLDAFLDILSEWSSSFCKQPSYRRAVLLALASLCVLGRACISRIISFLGLDQQDWSAHYKLFSRSRWQELDLFAAITQKALPLIDEPCVAVAFDDTKLKKTGKKIKTAFYQRDPLSPPFHVNLLYGLRFLQGSLLMPMYRKNDQPPRALPITFKEVPAVKKPGKYATEEELKNYAKGVREINLSTYFVDSLSKVRASLDRAGAKDKLLVAVVDGSFCNRTCMGTEVERTCVVARARKDAKLCFRASGNTQKIYGENKFTPKGVRQDESIPWQMTSIYHGGKWREVRYKEVKEVLWQKGTKQKPLRLIAIAPVPYRLTKSGRLYYRSPAYLLAQATELSSEVLLQKYFDRWQIEVNHREEKDILGVGQAQVRSPNSVPRQPAFVVAAYSALLLAGIKCFEDQRNGSFIPLPKWRRHAKRPSCLDLVQILRKELWERGENNTFLGVKINFKKAILRSAA
jgi:DDE superfamily endonuclease